MPFTMTQRFAAARIAVTQVRGGRHSNPASCRTCQPAQQLGIRVRVTKSKNAAPGRRPGNRRGCGSFGTGRQAGGDIRAIANARLDQAIAEQILISTDDRVAAYAELSGQIPARGQPQPSDEPPVEDRGSQTRVHLQR
jgi:hypothetical protein